jgi:hypothetical protein
MKTMIRLMLSRLDGRLVAGLLALNVADGLTTIVGLTRGAQENAPLAMHAVALGPLALVLFGLIGLAVQVMVLAVMPRQFQPAGWALVLVVAMVPVVNNLVVAALA